LALAKGKLEGARANDLNKGINILSRTNQVQFGIIDKQGHNRSAQKSVQNFQAFKPSSHPPDRLKGIHAGNFSR
jgi:hypothetical protein